VAGLDCQVAVIGGGPGGARTAELLASQGVDVLILEAGAEDVDVLCGGLLSRDAQDALGAEPPDSVRVQPARWPLEYHDLDNRTRLRLAPGYLNVHRPAFDAWLRERAVAAGARIAYHRRVSGIACTDTAVELAVGGTVIRALAAVDATGWRGLARRILCPTSPRPPLLYTLQGPVAVEPPPTALWAMYMSQLTPFYGWLIPKGDGVCLVGAGFPAASIARLRQAGQPTGAWAPLAPYIEYIERRGYRVVPLASKPRGSPLTCIRSLRNLWWGAGGVFSVGEAAGLVSPASGGGIHHALRHAAALAQALGARLAPAASSGGWSSEAARSVRSEVRALLRPTLRRLRLSCLKAAIAASPPMRAAAVYLLALSPSLHVERL